MRTTIVFFCGVICSLLVAAAAFRGGTPVDYTFTYQGQLRNVGALVNGPVDLRITLWDSDAAGAQVGPINNYQALPITDGRFAVGLNFGETAFDGSNCWVQSEFRSPAGSGQYLTLNPRDKIMATPYAMFALNGGNGIWNYNAKAQTVSVLGQKVGIGTANPTAALEVVGTGGDDAVKLPAGGYWPAGTGGERVRQVLGALRDAKRILCPQRRRATHLGYWLRSEWPKFEGGCRRREPLSEELQFWNSQYPTCYPNHRWRAFSGSRGAGGIRRTEHD